MRKCYHITKGEISHDVWEAAWEKTSVQEEISRGALSPILPVIGSHLVRQEWVLDGGCGLGGPLLLYHRQGYRVVGVDTASEALRRIKDFDTSALVAASDVTDLPFPDNTFGTYISLGVIEHDEGGPLKALVEAERVLRPGGVLLVTVPFVNAFRRLHSTRLTPGEIVKLRVMGRDDYAFILTDRCGRTEGVPEGYRFYQYEFLFREFSELVSRAGFEIQSSTVFGWSRGVRDLQALFNVYEFFRHRSRRRLGVDEGQGLPTSSGGNSSWSLAFRRWMSREERKGVVSTLVHNFMNYLFGHMVFFAARKHPGKGGQ